MSVSALPPSALGISPSAQHASGPNPTVPPGAWTGLAAAIGVVALLDLYLVLSMLLGRLEWGGLSISYSAHTVYWTACALAIGGGTLAIAAEAVEHSFLRRLGMIAVLGGLVPMGAFMLQGSSFGRFYDLLYVGHLVGAMAVALRALWPSDTQLRVSWWLMALPVGMTLVFQGWQYYELGYYPVRLLGQTFVMISLTTGAIALVVEKAHGNRLSLLFASFMTVAFLACNYAFPEARSRELPPALQSAIFVPHVTVYFVSYGTLIGAFATAVAALVAWRYAPARAESFARHSDELVMLGFPFLTIGISLGALWGKVAWGDWWFWDPKENWAFITWLTYLGYVHLRRLEGWNSRKAAWTLIAGSIIILVTYLVVNHLPTAKDSVHTYTAG